MLPFGFFCVFLKDIVHFLQDKKEDPAKCTKNGKTENELKKRAAALQAELVDEDFLDLFQLLRANDQIQLFHALSFPASRLEFSFIVMPHMQAVNPHAGKDFFLPKCFHS